MMKSGPRTRRCGLFNGDFELSNVDTDTVHPGWSTTEAAASGTSAARRSGSNDFLVLDDSGQSRTHNLFYLPANATHMLFRYEVDDADAANDLRSR